MKNLRKFNGKRVLSALLCLVLTLTMLVSTMPVAKALEPIRLAENTIDEAIADTGAFYLMTTNATVQENQPAPYYVRIVRGGEALPEATLKLEMIDVSAKYGDDYTIELLHSDIETANADGGTSFMEALSGDDVEQMMIDESGNDLSMTAEAAEEQLAETDEIVSENLNEAWSDYVHYRAAEDGFDLDALYSGSDDEDSGAAAQSAISRDFEAQTGLIDDRTPMKSTVSDEELGDVLQAGYGLDALNEMANALNVPYLTIDFAEGETEKTVVIKTINNDKGEGDKLTMLKLVTDAERTLVSETYSMLNLKIEDDEEWEQPTVSFAADTFEPEGGYAMVTVKREGLTTMVSSVHMTSTDGTATAGRDFSQVDTEVTFPYGIKERLLKIPVSSKLLEDGGSFTLTLSDPVDCVMGKTEAQALIPAGCDSYNPKTSADLAETGTSASEAKEKYADPIDLSKTYNAMSAHSEGYSKMDGDHYAIKASSDADGHYWWSSATWALKSYGYSGIQIVWSKNGNFTTNSKNELKFWSGNSSKKTAEEVKYSTKSESWGKDTDTYYTDKGYLDNVYVGVGEITGNWSKDPTINVYSITPILRPFEIKLLDADSSALQFVGPDGEFGDAKHVGLSYTAVTTLGEGGDLKWMKDGEDEVSVTLTNTSYSYIKDLEIVKYKEDMGGKITVLDTKTVKSSLTETSASFKLTDELVNEFSDSGFITYEKNGERGLKGKIGVRAVLAPYDFDFEISKDDYRGEVKVIEPENAPEGWRWHKGDYITVQTVIYDRYKKEYYPNGVSVNDQKTTLDDIKNTTWHNDTDKNYTVRQLDYAYLYLMPEIVSNDNRLVVKVANKNLKYYKQTQGFFKTAKQITSPEAGYRYYLLYDSDTVVPNKYYDLTAVPVTAGNVAGWKKDVGVVSYYENTHFFRTTWKRAENVVELLAPKKADATLVMNGTAYYSGATLDRRVEGEAWMPAKGAIVCVDAMHYDITGDDGKFSVKSLEGTVTGEDDITVNYPLYVCSGSALTYRIEASGTTRYFSTTLDGEKDENGVITLDVGKFKVSTIDKTRPYIASLVAYDQSQRTTSQIPITDQGIATVEVVVNNCGAEYDVTKKENTTRMELFAYHPKNAEPIKLATLDKNDPDDELKYKPKVDGNKEIWTFRFTSDNSTGLLSSDKLYVRLTTDRVMNEEVYDENGKPVTGGALSETVYPPIDSGTVFIQPAATLPDVEEFTMLETDSLMSEYIDFPIFGAFSAMFKAGSIVFKTTALPGNGLRFCFGIMPEKLSKTTGDTGTDTGNDYGVGSHGLSGIPSAFKDTKEMGQFLQSNKKAAKDAGTSSLVPIKGGGVGATFGIYLDLGRICTSKGESLEFMGGGVFIGAYAWYRLVWYTAIGPVPVYFGFDINLSAMGTLGVGKPDNANKEKPIEYFEPENVTDFTLNGSVNFNAYAGVGIRGVLGARGGVSTLVNFIWWPNVADRFPDQDALLKKNGHSSGIREGGFHADVMLKLWIDLVIGTKTFSYPLVDEDFGYYQDLKWLDDLNKKGVASTGASNEETPQMTSTFIYKEAGDPSHWTANANTDLAPTGSTYKQTTDFELKTGGYDHADPQLLDIGSNKLLLVYVDEDSSIPGDDRTVLRYQVYDKTKDLWLSVPGVIQAKNGDTAVNGALEPKLTDAGDKVMITWTAAILPDATHEDDDYMQKYLKQRNVYSTLIEKSALINASSLAPAQFDGELVSGEDSDMYNTNPCGLYYKSGENEYIGVTYLSSGLDALHEGFEGDDQLMAMTISATNNSYVRTAQYNAKTGKWETQFDPFKLNSTYDSETNTWTPIEDSVGLTTNNPNVIDLENTVWKDWLVYTFVVDEDNDLKTDEDREVFVKIQHLITGNATVNQLTNDAAYTDDDGTEHLGVAKSRPQLITTGDSLYLFWQHGQEDVAWSNLGKMIDNGIVDSDGSISDRDNVKWSYIFYPTYGADVQPTYAGFQPYADEKGNLYVVWLQGIEENGTQKQELYAQSLNVDNDSEESGYCWSDPIRLTETDAGNFLSVYNDEPAIADLGSGELLVVCNRFGTSKDATDFKTRSLTMRGIRFETIASVKPIELTAANEYPAPREELEFDVTVKNDGLKKADGFVVALLMLEKDQYDENKDYAEDFDPEKDDYALIAFSDFEDIKLNPSEITTVHIDDDNTFPIRYDDFALELAAPDKLAENGYVIVALALEYNGEDMNGYVFDNAPYKAFEDAVKVDPVYSVNAIADSNRHETGSLSSNDFTYSAVVNGDGNIPMRDSDRLVVGPANIDTAGEYMSSALFLDVPLSELEDVECETGTAKSYSAKFNIPEDRFTYGFTTIYTQIVDKDGRPLSSTQYINIESDAPYYVSVKDKDSDTQLDSTITLKVGEKIAMSGSYEPSTHFRDGKVIYSVEDTTVATVDENGVLTAVSEGSTILYASVDIYDAVREYTVTVSNDGYILGDADSDGKVTILDVTAIQRNLASLPVNGTFNAVAADVDSDNSTSIIDATWIQRYLAGIKTPYDTEIDRKKEYPVA